jgi:hypothetical protein
MMWKFMMLSLLASPVAAEELDFPLLIATYDLVADAPGCDGPGETAFSVAVSQTIPVWFYLAETTAAEPMLCTIEVRRGATVVDTVIPCEGDSEAEAVRMEQQGAFCEARKRLPATSELHLNLTACLSVGRFDILEGTWQLSAETEYGPYALAHDFSAGMVGVDFISEREFARTDIYSVVVIGGTSTPARLRTLIVPSDAITLERLSNLALKVVSEVDLHLIDSGLDGCRDEPGKCLEVRAPGNLDELLEKSESPFFDRILPYTALGDLGAQPDLGPFANAMNCDEG